MKSLKSHISLIIAFFAVLLTVQLFVSLDRLIGAYEKQLGENYTIVVVSDANLSQAQFKRLVPQVESVERLSPTKVLQSLQRRIHGGKINLMNLELPQFYRLHLARFIAPEAIRAVGRTLQSDPRISRVETFTQQHDTVFRLLQLFKGVVTTLAAVLFAVTSLLILKEMRLWQFQHRERMNIMALFGAPVWLRSAVLFRLAIVDAFIATFLSAATFVALDYYGWNNRILTLIQVQTPLLQPAKDFPLLLGIAVSLSILLASLIVAGHKEEV